MRVQRHTRPLAIAAAMAIAADEGLCKPGPLTDTIDRMRAIVEAAR